MEKKYIYLFSVILLAAIAISFFVGKNLGQERQIIFSDPEDSTATPGTLALSGEPINYRTALEMYKTYTDHWNGSREYRTRALWFSYHNVQEYLDTLKNQLGRAGYTDTSKIGLKVYMGALPNVIHGYKYRLTTFFVPTIVDRNNIKKDTLDKSVVSDSAFANKRDYLLLLTDGFNHGDLCPPETTCGKSIFE